MNIKIKKLLGFEKKFTDDIFKLLERQAKAALKTYNEITLIPKQIKKLVYVVEKWYGEESFAMQISKWQSISLTIVPIHGKSQFRFHLTEQKDESFKVEFEAYEADYYDPETIINNIERGSITIFHKDFSYFTEQLLIISQDHIENAKVLRRLIGRLDKYTITQIKKMTSERSNKVFQESIKMSFET